MLPSPENCCSGARVGLGACSGTGEGHAGKGGEGEDGVLLPVAFPSLKHGSGDVEHGEAQGAAQSKVRLDSASGTVFTDKATADLALHGDYYLRGGCPRRDSGPRGNGSYVGHFRFRRRSYKLDIRVRASIRRWGLARRVLEWHTGSSCVEAERPLSSARDSPNSSSAFRSHLRSIFAVGVSDLPLGAYARVAPQVAQHAVDCSHSGSLVSSEF